MDYIRIEGLEVDCIVGVRPRERLRRQSVRIDIVLALDLSIAAKSGRIAQTIDYARVADEISLLLRFREYRLIEMATEELCAMLLGSHAMLESVRIRIEKPAALHGRARSASVEVDRRRSELPVFEHPMPYGRREILFESTEASLCLLHIDAAGHLPPSVEPGRRQVEWVVQGELVRNGVAVRPCDPIVWPRGRPDAFDNVSRERAVLFSCSCPESREGGPQNDVTAG